MERESVLQLNRMHSVTFIFPLLIMLFSISACYYDSEEYLFPKINNQCDTVNTTFSQTVKPIIENNCYSCHSNGTSSMGGNIRLEDYSDIKVYADNGKLLGSITHANGYSPMPKGVAKLEDCKITMIQKWINDGTLNN